MSDYDVAILSRQIVARSVELELSLHGALDDVSIERLGLTAVREQLSRATEREVNFLVIDERRSVNILDRDGVRVPKD